MQKDITMSEKKKHQTQTTSQMECFNSCHRSTSNFATNYQPNLKTKPNLSMLERINHDATTEKRKEESFRKYRTPEDHATHLSQVFRNVFQSKKVTPAVIADLNRAFGDG